VEVEAVAPFIQFRTPFTLVAVHSFVRSVVWSFVGGTSLLRQIGSGSLFLVVVLSCGVVVVVVVVVVVEEEVVEVVVMVALFIQFCSLSLQLVRSFGRLVVAARSSFVHCCCCCW